MPSKAVPVVSDKIFYYSVIISRRRYLLCHLDCHEKNPPSPHPQKKRAYVIYYVVFARALADQRTHEDCRKRKNKSIERSSSIYSTPALSVLFFSMIEHGVVVALVFYYKDVLEIVRIQEPSNSQLFFDTERTQLNAVHAKLLEKLIPLLWQKLSDFLRSGCMNSKKFWEKKTKLQTSHEYITYHKGSECLYLYCFCIFLFFHLTNMDTIYLIK